MGTRPALVVQPAGARRLVSVDALRGIAALAVLLFHIRHNPEEGRLNAWCLLAIPLDFGYLGVALFLVISGFCIHLRTAQRLAADPGSRPDWAAFWRRRFYRLYPPYLGAIILSLLVYSVVIDPSVVHSDCLIRSLPLDLLTHLFMIHNLFLVFRPGLGNGAFWTLGLEEQLYALYAAYLALRRRVGWLNCFIAVLVLTVAWRLWDSWAVPNHLGICPPPFELSWVYWPFAYWAFWVLGAVAAEAYAGIIRLPPWCYRWRPMAAFALVGLAMNSITLGRFAGSKLLARLTGVASWTEVARPFVELSDLFLAVALFIWLNRWLRAEREGQFGSAVVRRLAQVGLISYSLYLTHVPFVYVGDTVFLRIGLGDKPHEHLLRYLVMIPVSIAGAVVFFHLVEKHFLRQSATTPQAHGDIYFPNKKCSQPGASCTAYGTKG